MEDIKHEMNVVIQELEKQGINPNSHTDPNMTGLGDVVENVLNTFGITQERFKAWFNLKECNCTKRKAYLNNLFSWKNNNTQAVGKIQVDTVPLSMYNTIEAPILLRV